MDVMDVMGYYVCCLSCTRIRFVSPSSTVSAGRLCGESCWERCMVAGFRFTNADRSFASMLAASSFVFCSAGDCPTI